MAPKKKKKGKGKGKKGGQGQRKKAPSGGGGPGPSPAAAPGPAEAGESSQPEPSSVPQQGAPPPEAAPAPEARDRGALAGLRSRPDLNGRRVEVRGPAPGTDGAPRFRVELLFGAGAGTVLKVKAASLELDKDRVLDPAMATLVAEMQALAPGAVPEEERRDWAGLPIEVLAKIAETHAAQTEAGWAAYFCWTESENQAQMERWKRLGPSRGLFVFSLVCRGWRKAQLKVGGPLRTRVESDVILPGSVALVKWALAEGCPREHEDGEGATLAQAAAQFGHEELVRWLINEQGFAMDKWVMEGAAFRGNQELVNWLKAKGCPEW